MAREAGYDHIRKILNARLRNLCLIISTKNHLKLLNESVTCLKAVF